MLNLLTLHIQNKKVSQNYAQHQANTVDRLLWGGIAAVVLYMLNCLLISIVSKKHPQPVVIIINSLLLIIVVVCKLFKRTFPTNNKFHEHIGIMIAVVPTVFCCLTNLNLLPNYLMGSGIDEARADYTGKFFLIFLF